MSRKHFSWLLFLTFVVAGLVLMVPGKTSKKSSIEQTVLLSGAAAKVNDIDWLRLTSAGNVTVATLKREGSVWVVEEASAYQADWERLKTLLTGLSQAEVIEAKTANPEYYPRLGVEDMSLPKAGGVMIEFSADSGLPALIIGKSAQGRDGQYARLRDSTASMLLDRRIDVSAVRSDWLDKTIVDISDAEVVEVEIKHPDGESIKALKFSADDENFKLQDIPDGMEIKSDWTVNTLGGALAALSLDSVAPDGDLDWNNAIRFRLLTADGLLLEAELLAINADETTEKEYWIRLQAGLYTTAVESSIEEVDEAGKTSERAESINQRVAGWAYRIPSYTFDSMTRRSDDLLQPAGSP